MSKKKLKRRVRRLTSTVQVLSRARMAEMKARVEYQGETFAQAAEIGKLRKEIEQLKAGQVLTEAE